MVWVNRRGEEIGTVGSDPYIWNYAPRLSPDGRLLAISHYEASSTSGDIWIHDLERGTAYPLTVGEESDDTLAIWTPDGSELVFVAEGGGRPSGIYRIEAQRSGAGKLWSPSDRFKLPAGWLAGGDLLYQENDEAGSFSLWSLDVEGGGEPRQLSPAGIAETSPDLSPDGQWIAFGSDASRRLEVYVRRVDDSTRAGAIRISSEGGNFPRWRGDGREIFYVDDNGRLLAVPIELGAKPIVGAPVALFAAQLEEAADRQYDVTSDGQRFLLNRALTDDRNPIAVILGWQQRLRETAP
jgi:Tol biopolymer transport system component